MMLQPNDIQTLILTLKLASAVTVILIFIGIPMAWWLANSRSKIAAVTSAFVSVPLILPPTVLGFYLLLLMGPEGFIGEISKSIGIGTLPFSFAGLVFASVIYSMPFTIQPLQSAFEAVPGKLLEAAATMRASPLDTFISVVLPVSKNGILVAVTLTFAHTIGEFGVILMIGGNIPGETQVASVKIYDYVESMEYENAHNLSFVLLTFSVAILLLLQFWKHRSVNVSPLTGK